MALNDPYIYTPDIQGYKNAVWDFMLEHSEPANGNGALFIKFHTDTRIKFENRILGRWKFNYHRDGLPARKEAHENAVKAAEEEQAKKKAKWEEKKRQKKEARFLPKWKRILQIIIEKQ